MIGTVIRFASLYFQYKILKGYLNDMCVKCETCFVFVKLTYRHHLLSYFI